MAAIRDNTAVTSRARRRQVHRRLRVRARRVVLPRPEVKPSRPRRAISRLAIGLLIALAMHGALWFLVPKHRPAPTGSKGVIEVQMVRKGDKKQRDRTPPQTKTQTPTPPQVQAKQQHRPVPQPAPQNPAEQKAYEPTPSDTPSSPVAANPASPPSTPGSTSSPAPGAPVDPGKIQLFDPSVIGRTVTKWSEDLPSQKEFMAPGAQGDGNSPEQEKARVSSRLSGQFAQAEAEGRVAGGLVSSCNDGIDQGQDGLMDCADPGCRLLPACSNTKEFKNLESKPIFDDDVRGTVGSVEVDDGDGDKIRALSVRFNVVHSSPGDLQVEIEHNGHKEVLRLADRSNHFFEKAFLAADFIGDDANGKWTIRIRDVIRGTSGTLRGWTLFVTR